MTTQTKPLSQVIAERVRVFRTERGWNQRELARRLGEVLPGPPSWEDHTTVNLIEKGKRRVLAAELFALAHVFEVDAAALVTDPGGPTEVDLGRGSVPLRWGANAADAALLSTQLSRLRTVAAAALMAEAQARDLRAHARMVVGASELLAGMLETQSAVVEDVAEWASLRGIVD